jgi:hypothetical protein
VADWSTKRVLITARTYPVPAQKNIEVSCTAGITDDGKWVRLFPVPYRFLEPDKRFKKYQWIIVDCTKAKGDARPESFALNADTIRIGDDVPPGKDWRARREILRPLMRPSMCHIKRERDENQFPTLAVFKPAKIKQLIIEAAETPDWTADQLASLRQIPLFQHAPANTLEKIPVTFKYEFQCADLECTGHEMSCTDWEMGQSYRRWVKDYGDEWEPKFRLRYEQEMIHKNDTHFFVGTVHRHPHIWIIVGLFYPPRPTMNDLFG